MVLSPFSAWAGHHIAPKCSRCSGAGREETLGSLERRTGMPRATGSGTAPRALLLGGMGGCWGEGECHGKSFDPPRSGINSSFHIQGSGCFPQSAAGMSGALH